MRIRWRGLELPSRVVCNREKLTDTYGEFHVEPFERGFGHTVGNSLRRILLSSLEGSAVTKIKIQGVQHEFSSIPGMVEDITDLVLNIKGLVVKNHSEQSRTIRIERDRRGVITALLGFLVPGQLARRRCDARLSLPLVRYTARVIPNNLLHPHQSTQA